MSNLDYIKSYLIKVGVDVDNNSVNKYDNFIKKTDFKFSALVKKIGSAAVKVNAFYDALLIGAYKFSSSIAKADMDLQKLSKRMYMSRDSAKALQTTLNAMGLDQSDLQDIALNPELTAQYRELLKLSRSLGTPDSVKETLRDIRAIGFEFSKLNVIFSHFTERVVHFAFKSLGKPARDFKKFLNDFNTRFAKQIDAWAQRIGTALGIIVRLAFRFKELLKNISDLISGLWGKLTGIQKGIIAAIGAISLVIKASSIWRLITIISGFLMLLDDYKVYKQGGVSANILKPVWRTVDNQLNNPDSIFNKIRDLIKETFNFEVLTQKLEDVKNKIKEFDFDKFGEKLKEGLKNHWENIKKFWENFEPLKKVREILEAFWNWLKEKLGIGKRDLSKPSKNFYTQKVPHPTDPKTGLGLNYEGLPTNPWTEEGQNRLKEVVKVRKAKEYEKNQTLLPGVKPNSYPDILNAPRDSGTQTLIPYSGVINQEFNFEFQGVEDPYSFSNTLQTIIRNNKPRFV